VIGPPGVRAAPNESRITGTVVAVDKSSVGTRWTVRIDTAEGTDKLPNFAHRHIGGTVQIDVPPNFGKSIDRNDRIAATICYEGDEGGGALFLVNLDARKL